MPVYDFSAVSLKELREVYATIKEEMRAMRNTNSQQRYEDLSLYSGFLYNAIQTKAEDETVNEMNKHYFGDKITLKK
jgi:hypothetical protein